LPFFLFQQPMLVRQQQFQREIPARFGHARRRHAFQNTPDSLPVPRPQPLLPRTRRIWSIGSEGPECLTQLQRLVADG
jgi:hypothetical protein